jgi:hypothetical protein
VIAKILTQAVDDVLLERLRDRKQQEQVVTSVMTGFEALRKKPVDDLPQRMKALEGQVRQMAEDIRLGFVNGRLTVKVAGSSESLMIALRRGTDWFEPWEEIDEIVLAASLVDPLA